MMIQVRCHSYWSMITNEWYIFVSMKSICDHETHCSADNSVLLPRSPILRRARVGPVAEPSHYLASDVSFSAFWGNHQPKPGTRGPWLAARRRQREFWTAIRPPGDPQKPAHDQCASSIAYNRFPKMLEAGFVRDLPQLCLPEETVWRGRGDLLLTLAHLPAPAISISSWNVFDWLYTIRIEILCVLCNQMLFRNQISVVNHFVNRSQDWMQRSLSDC